MQAVKKERACTTFHLPESIEGPPNFCGAEQQIESAVCSSRGKSLFLAQNRSDFGRIRSAFANALHMHQPLIPAGGSNLTTADIISNLKDCVSFGLHQRFLHFFLSRAAMSAWKAGGSSRSRPSDATA
jgi:hypothetical protein